MTFDDALGGLAIVGKEALLQYTDLLFCHCRRELSASAVSSSDLKKSVTGFLLPTFVTGLCLFAENINLAPALIPYAVELLLTLDQVAKCDESAKAGEIASAEEEELSASACRREMASATSEDYLREEQTSDGELGWAFQNEDGSWIPFDPRTQSLLRRGQESGRGEFNVRSGGENMMVDLVRGVRYSHIHRAEVTSQANAADGA